MSAQEAMLPLGCWIQPNDERPGFGLSGEVHQHSVEDWSFSEDSGEIFIETVTSYWIPSLRYGLVCDCGE